jgi:hypothetical protein
MTKSINTLVKDIQAVIDGNGGWDETISKYSAELIADTLDRRFNPEESTGPRTLRMSALGTPCKRKLWYDINNHAEGEPLPTSARFKFLYGDILEVILISLARAAGHRVEGVQDTLEIAGIRGHRDCVIDGITVDVKSASSYGYRKFESGALRDDDPFGYISQLSSYVYAGRDSEVESHPSLGAFLVVDKQNGHICLDMYDFGPELDGKLAEIEEVKRVVSLPKEPPRAFKDVPEIKNRVPTGNHKLGVNCSYCNYKNMCWPTLRTFVYSTGPVFLTKVVKEPRVEEAK